MVIYQLVENISKYTIFSTIDLTSAYRLIPLKEHEKKYTAFEACGQLLQFTRIPFGVTNGASEFVRVLNDILFKEQLKDTFAYLDDITICGNSK